MKASHYSTPRTQHDGTWVSSGQAIHYYPQSKMERAVGVILAVVIGIFLAAAAVHWWAS